MKKYLCNIIYQLIDELKNTKAKKSKKENFLMAKVANVLLLHLQSTQNTQY